MEQSEVWIWLTRIGALTGFAAFLLRLWEFHRDRRPKLRIVCSLNSDPTWGNTITVLNSSKIGTSIHYYSLEALPKSWLNRLWPRFTNNWHNIEFSLEDRTVNITVPPHGHADLEFKHGDHFTWGASRTDDLYLRIWTATRKRPFCFFIVGARGR